MSGYRSLVSGQPEGVKPAATAIRMEEGGVMMGVIVFAFGLIVWLAALWTIFDRPKFRRKWLWALLTLPTVRIPLEWLFHHRFSVLLPVGALYVLLFAWLGPKPKAVVKPRPFLE